MVQVLIIGSNQKLRLLLSLSHLIGRIIPNPKVKNLLHQTVASEQV